MKNKLSDLLLKLKYLVVNYPLILLASLATVFVIVHGIETNPNDNDEYLLLRMGLTFSLGISLFFALKMLSQRLNKGFLVQFAGVLFLTIYYFVFPKNEDDFNETYFFIIVPVFILSHLLVAFIPFIRKENLEESFWQYNKNLFINLFLTAIFTGVLTGGIELAIVAVQELFSVDFDDKIYPEVFVTLAIFGSTCIFLLFNETGLNYLERDGKYPVVLKFFTQFILIPLLLIYVVILYFYSIKIVINWELPRGWVSYLVLAYSIIGILALLLVHPLKNEKAKSWVFFFSKIFYYTLIPLIVLLFTAIFTRVLQYGYTEARYFVLLISLWLTTVVLYFIFNKKATIKFIPISLFAFGLFALIFPYMNAFSVSKRSQQKELLSLLEQNKLLVNGKIDFNKKIVDTIAYNIQDKFEFLSERNETAQLLPYLDSKIKSEVKENKYWYSGLFKNITTTSTDNYNNYRRLYSDKKYFEIKEYQYFIKGGYNGDVETKVNGTTFKAASNYNSNPSLKITVNNTTKDITPLLDELLKKYKNTSGDNTLDEISLETDIDKYHVKILFESISWYTNETNYNFDNVTYLLKENK
jgi:hypothetical protein